MHAPITSAKSSPTVGGSDYLFATQAKAEFACYVVILCRRTALAARGRQLLKTILASRARFPQPPESAWSPLHDTITNL